MSKPTQKKAKQERARLCVARGVGEALEQTWLMRLCASRAGRILARMNISGKLASPFNKKHTHSFASANTMPAIAGPAKRETWKAIAFNATAFGIKARSPTMRCTNAGRGPHRSALDEADAQRTGQQQCDVH